MSALRIVLPVFFLGTLSLGCGKGQNLPEPQAPEPVFAPADAEPASKELWATIEIVSSPAGMEALVDGRSVGKTPTKADKLKPGHYDVTFKDEANGDATYGVEVGEGEYQLVKHNVVPRADNAAPANAKQ
jgi:hypothetical protein